MGLPMRQPDLGERRPRGVKCVVAVEELERQRHVLQRRHGGDEVEGLEDNADIGGTETREIVLVKTAEIGAKHRNAPLRGTLEAGDDHEQGRFA